MDFISGLRPLTSALLFWDPSPVVFTIPGIGFAVRWYSLFFAAGFLLGYFLVRRALERRISRREATVLTDRMAWFVVGGTIVGARLGHVFFYDWTIYYRHPEAIFKIWEGGLASHGGVVGVLLGLLLFRAWMRKRYPTLTFLTLLDALALPAALVACCIRLGNFFNQEILGTPSSVPWAVVFGHPSDGSAPQPVHPTQLYEAVFYLAIFGLALAVWKRLTRPGQLSGLVLTLIFGFRFCIEFLKAPQALTDGEGLLVMGQLLSIPCVIFGLILLSGRLQRLRNSQH